MGQTASLAFRCSEQAAKLWWALDGRPASSLCVACQLGLLSGSTNHGFWFPTAGAGSADVVQPPPQLHGAGKWATLFTARSLGCVGEGSATRVWAVAGCRRLQGSCRGRGSSGRLATASPHQARTSATPPLSRASLCSIPTLLQVLTAILQSAKLPGVEIDPRDSGANVKASALVRMDEQLTQFAVSEVFRTSGGGVCAAGVVCASESLGL